MTSIKNQPLSAAKAIRVLLAILLVLTYIPFIYGMLTVAVIPAKYLWIVLPIHGLVSLILLAILVFGSKFANRKVVILLLTVIVFALAAVNLYGYSVAKSTKNLFTTIQPAKVSYVEYSVLARKNQPSSLKTAKSVAILSTDSLKDKVQAKLQDKTTANIIQKDSLANLVVALNSSEADLLAIKSSTVPILTEADATFNQNSTVIATFKVEGESQSVTQLDSTKPFVLYISGIDTEGPVSTTSRSDVNILMGVNPQSRQIVTINTPRDYYVQLHGTTGLKDKLTHAGTYGIDMSRQTMEDLYQTQVPYYVRINFTSLVNIVNAVGPITVYSDYAFDEFKQGYNTLNAEQALRFSRERYRFSEGDRQRGRNQQHVIEAIIDKMSRPENAVKLPAIIDSLQSSIETNVASESLSMLVNNQLNDLRGWKVQSLQVDGSGAMLPTYSYGSQPLYVMIPDQTTVDRARQSLVENQQPLN